MGFHRCHLLFGGQKATRHGPATSHAMPQCAHMHVHTRVHTHVYTHTRTNTSTNPVLCKPASFAHGNSQTRTPSVHTDPACTQQGAACTELCTHPTSLVHAAGARRLTHVYTSLVLGAFGTKMCAGARTHHTHTDTHIPGNACLHTQPEAHNHTRAVLSDPSPPLGTQLRVRSTWTPLQGSRGTSMSQTTHMGTLSCPCRAWFCSHRPKTYLGRMCVPQMCKGHV